MKFMYVILMIYNYGLYKLHVMSGLHIYTVSDPRSPITLMSVSWRNKAYGVQKKAYFPPAVTCNFAREQTRGTARKAYATQTTDLKVRCGIKTRLFCVQSSSK